VSDIDDDIEEMPEPPKDTDAQQAKQGTKHTFADFRAYAPARVCIYMPCKEPWPNASVDTRLPAKPLVDESGSPALNARGKMVMIPASKWLEQNQSVEQMTWAPGEPELIESRLVVDGGWIEKPNVTCLNLYRPPRITLGDAGQAGLWVDHVRRIYPNDADHIIAWLAQRVQKPEIKINHALVLSGMQGIGKDTILQPVKYAVGPWNFHEISPKQMLGRFNGFAKSVILRINEARDLGEVDRFAFYDHTKVYAAAPPDVLRVDEKNLREYSVFNCLGLLITTNHETDGLYLPEDDRRHYLAWSDWTKDQFPTDYWNNIYGWYAKDGSQHVAAFLHSLDISRFDPKAPPPKTEAFWANVEANYAPESDELCAAIEELGEPDVITIEQLLGKNAELAWMTEQKHKRVVPHRLKDSGYSVFRKPKTKSGLWQFGNRRLRLYVKVSLRGAARLKAALNFKP
jgi:Family of unknown function (DUF5906)